MYRILEASRNCNKYTFDATSSMVPCATRVVPWVTALGPETVWTTFMLA